MPKTESMVEETTKVDFPSKYKVIFHNDDITPMGFVIEVLFGLFDLSRETAVKLMLEIHNSGSGVAGVYIKSIAESKITLVREVSIKANYPLVVTMEKE